MSTAKRSAAEFELDLGRYELRRSGSRVKLEKKPMELLMFLVSRREQMVTREEIIRKIWRTDLFIDAERNLNNIVRKIRTALGDDPDRPRFLETVVGVGYRFIGPMRVVEAQFPRAETLDIPIDETSRSIAVLPLVMAGKANDDEGVGIGFADALAAQLGKLQGVVVLPSSATIHFSAAVSPKEVAAKLATRFVVHGAIRLQKGEWRLSVEMLDAHSGRVCFSKSFDTSLDRFAQVEGEVAREVARALKLPLNAPQQRPRHSRNPLAYAEFMRGYKLSGSGDPAEVARASQHLGTAVARDPNFALAHATLSFVFAVQHFESDPTSALLEKAEFHGSRALELDPELPEALVARAFLVWGPSKNFQHLEAITDLKRALSLQKNLPHAYNRLGTILAHVGLLDHALEMFERGRPFHPKRAVSPSVVQVYGWKGEFERAAEVIAAWREESPNNKYALHWAPFPAMMTGDWDAASQCMEESLAAAPHDPLMISMQGLLHARMGKAEAAMDCVMKACSYPQSFGHAHHSYYQIACIHALVGRPETAFAWLERTVNTGFACWPFFLKDPCLENLRAMPEFGLLVSSLQAKYPDHLGLL
ncbi:winged helix-turn-helix domain-containing protein [Candidatus Korobacter versatilis]|nr:winged helix-turn-helix domain-containing protein [Candidatus Koribacter versatilis]